MKTTRRGFMKVTAAAGGGLSVGFLLDGCSHVSGAQSLGGSFHPNAWVRITGDDTITFFLDRAEMGQGVVTSHVQMLCEELCVPPGKVKVEFAPADFRQFGVQLTGGSTSTTAQWDVLRRAGATARELLRAAAARRWRVPASEIGADGGVLSHPSRGTLRYGDVADEAARGRAIRSAKLKSPEEWRFIGAPLRRLDAKGKVDGSAEFGIDVKLPGMLTAVVVRPPVLQAHAVKIRDDAACAVKGVRHVVEIPQGVAVVADTYWQARKAAGLLEIEWSDSEQSRFSSDGLRKAHDAALASPGKPVKSAGDVDAALAQATKRARAVYELPFLAHAPMEPLNATAFVEEDRCRVWTGTQSATVAKETAKRLTGFSRRKVEIVTTLMGGGFGRRGLPDFVAEAVEVSKRLRLPVKVVWSREDDLRHGYYRPAATAVLEGAVGDDGMPVAWHQRLTGQSLFSTFGPILNELGPKIPFLEEINVGLADLLASGHLVDPTTVEGSREQPYGIANQRIELALVDTGVPVSAWRSVGHSINAFIIESFIDELAALGERDPLAVRLALLRDQPQHRRVLEKCAEAIGWATPPPPGRFRGIAQHACFGSYCAQAVEISVQDKLRVHRVVCAIDCGRAVNPDLVAAQMESGVIFGLSAALYQSIDYDGGRVRQSNFHDYPLLRFGDAPEIETHILPSEDRPRGVGELAVPPIAPALANAFFAATKVRLRRMPMMTDIHKALTT